MNKNGKKTDAIPLFNDPLLDGPLGDDPEVEDPLAEDPLDDDLMDTIPLMLGADLLVDDEIPDCHGKDLTTDERDTILIKVSELYPGRLNSQQRIDLLNETGVPLNGVAGGWTPKKFGDALGKAKKRLTDK